MVQSSAMTVRNPSVKLILTDIVCDTIPDSSFISVMCGDFLEISVQTPPQCAALFNNDH